MPKEYVHWAIAEKIFSQSPEKIKDIIVKNKHLYYLGAVAPDTPYYYLWGDKKDKFREAADRLHGRYEKNTFAFLPKMIEKYKNDLTDDVLAFLLGVMTHVFTDSTMHPIIFHLCGDPENENPEINRYAHVRHRVFEASLDLKYKKEFPLVNKGKYKISYSLLGKKKSFFIRLLGDYLFEDNQGNEKEVKRNVSIYSNIQNLFTNKFLYNVLTLLNRIKKGGYSDIIALFYFSRSNHPFASLKDEFSFQHPVTGEKQTTSIYRLEEKAVSGCIKTFALFKDALDKNNLGDFVRTLRGPHLDTGLFDNRSKMKFFNLLKLTKL
ncbi:MAG: zinc dependent phospholipase C family protein [Spirochaetales bacterium]|nr:zinc dependent phospholipase C family protein [Spirochaetales bacterium]